MQVDIRKYIMHMWRQLDEESAQSHDVWRAILPDSSGNSLSKVCMKKTSSLGPFEKSAQFPCHIASFESRDSKEN
ncbi:hypothetical protein ACTXT7_016657 [Hymenolepis weldensis]